MDVSVVVPTYERPSRVRRLLDALAAQDLAPDRWELLVVDDASSPEAARAIDAAIAASTLPVTVIHQQRNGGPAAARNAGLHRSRAPIVAFVDDDCVPDPGWSRAIVDAFARNPRLGVVQGLTRRPAGRLGAWTMFREITDETPWFEACNIAYRRDVLLAAGGFDEGIRWYGEDTSAGWRVVETGAERDFEPAAAVTHDLEERGLWFRVRHGWLERNLVGLAARHPGLRRSAFWRPWAFRRESVAFPLALAGAGIARRRPLTGLLLALPYLWVRRLPLRDARRALGMVAIDAAQLAGHVEASLRHRTLVL